MFTAIDSLPPVAKAEENWLLFLPEDEFHELGLLFSNYFLRSKGKNVIYLGPNVPLSSVKHTLEDVSISNLLLFMVHRDLPEKAEEYLSELKELAGARKVLIAGGGLDPEMVKGKENLVQLRSVEDLEKEMNSIKVV